MKPKPLLVLNHLTVPVSRDLFEFAGFGWSIRDFDPPLLELTNAVMKQDRKNRVAKMIMDFEFSASLLITCVDMPVAIAETIILVTKIRITAVLMCRFLTIKKLKEPM